MSATTSAPRGVSANATGGVDRATVAARRAGSSSALQASPSPTLSAGRPEPRLRGRLVLAEEVVEKIAAQAAVEAGATTGRSSRALGLGEPDLERRPAVDVDLSVSSADLALKVGVGYPGSIRVATQRVREHVTARVEQLTGVDVRRVDIDVTVLRTEADGQPKVLR